MSFRSLNGTQCLNPMRDHGAIGIEPLKARYNVTKLELTIILLSF